MPSRDELIEEAARGNLRRVSKYPWDMVASSVHGRMRDAVTPVVDDLLARWPHIAGPERVETHADMDALPDGSVIVTSEAYIAYTAYGRRLWRNADNEPMSTFNLGRPATVLHRPDATNPEEGTR